MRTEDRTDDAYRNALIQQERTGAGIWDLLWAAAGLYAVGAVAAWVDRRRA